MFPPSPLPSPRTNKSLFRKHALRAYGICTEREGAGGRRPEGRSASLRHGMHYSCRALFLPGCQSSRNCRRHREVKRPTRNEPFAGKLFPRRAKSSRAKRQLWRYSRSWAKEKPHTNSLYESPNWGMWCVARVSERASAFLSPADDFRSSAGTWDASDPTRRFDFVSEVPRAAIVRFKRIIWIIQLCGQVQEKSAATAISLAQRHSSCGHSLVERSAPVSDVLQQIISDWVAIITIVYFRCDLIKADRGNNAALISIRAHDSSARHRALSDFFDNRTIYSSASNLCRGTSPRLNEWVRNAVACRDCVRLLFLAFSSWRRYSHHVASRMIHRDQRASVRIASLRSISINRRVSINRARPREFYSRDYFDSARCISHREFYSRDTWHPPVN